MGREWTIDAVMAGNVTVRLLPASERTDAARVTLLEAAESETVRVVGISQACQGSQRRRLLDLGVVRGAEVTPELVSANGDPIAYRIRGALIALRRAQAEEILVERLQEHLAEEVA
jgi:DtxR family Mn-dependent transcriptional regulator